MTVLNTSASNFSTTEATSPRSEDKGTRDHSEQKGDVTLRGRGVEEVQGAKSRY